MLILYHKGYSDLELEELLHRTSQIINHLQANTGNYNCLERIPHDCVNCNVKNICRDMRNLRSHVEELIFEKDKKEDKNF